MRLSWWLVAYRHATRPASIRWWPCVMNERKKMTTPTIENSQSKSATVTRRIAEASPIFIARIAGVFSLLTILTGVFAQGFISDRLVVSGDAAATATNILTHRGLFQLGFAVFLIEMACNITMTVLC